MKPCLPRGRMHENVSRYSNILERLYALTLKAATDDAKRDASDLEVEDELRD